MGDLSQATDALYDAFRGYPLRPRIETCPHCELGDAESSLHTRPLRDLRWADLGVYPFKAMTTFGDEIDFKHFLPRILELCTIDQLGARYDVDVIFRKLEYASWTSWPEREVRALRNFVAAWKGDLAATLQETKGDPWQLESLDEAICESEFAAKEVE